MAEDRGGQATRRRRARPLESDGFGRALGELAVAGGREARGAARARDLAETLLGEGIEAGFRGESEIAGERQLKADAEAIAAAGSNDRLAATRRCGDVPVVIGAGELAGAAEQQALAIVAQGRAVEVALERAVGQQLASDVVEPDAPAQIREPLVAFIVSFSLVSGQQGGKIVIDKIANTLDRQVGCRI